MVTPTNRFRSLDIGKLLYETLRAYYSVNSSGKVNWLYKYCACLLQPLVAPLADYESKRRVDGLIANSKFQIGQLVNVLNFLYDPIQNRIFITQGFYNQTVDRNFNETPILFARNFNEDAISFSRNFDDPISFTLAVIHVPSDADLSQIIATVAQMAIEGIQYTIITF